MTELHGGTVTFVFTDIEGSTELLKRLGERYADAVAAAVAAQRALGEEDWPDDTALGVRMSLHTGEPVVGEEGYVGIDVHRAARICAAGHGGQILLSATTAALVSGALPEGVSKRDLGEVRPKDIDEPERVTQLVVDGLPESFPPLRAEQDEPMDFGDRLARKIQADVERPLEMSLSGATADVAQGTTHLAFFGLVNLVLLVAAIVVIVLLINLVV